MEDAMKTLNADTVQSFHLPRWEEIPGVDLYLDQVVRFINEALEPIATGGEGKKTDVLTKSMINNYVKNSLLIAPKGKLYSKKQISKLFVICVLKKVYSMAEIKRATELALEDMSIPDTYDHFCTLFEEILSCTFRNRAFSAEDEDERQRMMKSILLSCSYKIYVQSLL